MRITTCSAVILEDADQGLTYGRSIKHQDKNTRTVLIEKFLFFSQHVQDDRRTTERNGMP